MRPRSPIEPAPLPFHIRAMSVRAIFDHFQIVFFRDAQNFVHVREAHAQVDRQNRFGLRRDGLLDQLRVQTICLRIHIHEYRNRVEQQHRPNRSFPGVRRNNHFVAGPDAESPSGTLESPRFRCSRTGHISRCWNAANFLANASAYFPGNGWPPHFELVKASSSAANSSFVAIGHGVNGVLRRVRHR